VLTIKLTENTKNDTLGKWGPIKENFREEGVDFKAITPKPHPHPIPSLPHYLLLGLCMSGLPGPKKSKRPNLAISSFKKGQILKDEKRPNKGQISFKKFVKITKLKFTIS